MRKIIKLDKVDIKTSQLGVNFQIETTGDTDIIFSPEALEELAKDFLNLKAGETKYDVQINGKSVALITGKANATEDNLVCSALLVAQNMDSSLHSGIIKKTLLVPKKSINFVTGED